METMEMENAQMLKGHRGNQTQHHQQIATKIDIEFTDLVYTVKTPRSKGGWSSLLPFSCIHSMV